MNTIRIARARTTYDKYLICNPDRIHSHSSGPCQDFDLAPQLDTPLHEEPLPPPDQSGSDTTDVHLGEPSKVVSRRKLPKLPQSLDSPNAALSLSSTDTNAAESLRLQSSTIQNICFNADEVRIQVNSILSYLRSLIRVYCSEQDSFCRSDVRCLIYHYHCLIQVQHCTQFVV